MTVAESKQDYPLKAYYRKIYRSYDLVNRIFTFGQDRKWRTKAVAACLENKPNSILDICTGTGDLILEIGENAVGAPYLAGYDFSAEMLSLAGEKADKTGVQPEFIEGDVSDMPFKAESFDVAGISFGLRNLVYENSNAEKHLSEISRVLRPGGRFVILESSKPGNPVWRFLNGIYLQAILPYLGGIISGNLKAYRYLGKSSKNYYTRSEMSAILESAGFKVIQSQSLFLGSVMLMVAEKQEISG